MKISVVILAAGFGTRMKSHISKVLQPFCGEKLIDSVIKNALSLSDDIQIVLHHQKEEIKKYLNEKYQNNNFKFITQDMNAHKGTGGALFGLCYKYDDVLILNGDMPLIKTKSLEKLCKNNADFVLCGFECERENAYGRIILENEKVVKIVETKDATNEQKRIKLCNGGIYKIKSKLLNNFIPKLQNNNAQNEYYLTDTLQMAVDGGFCVDFTLFSEDEFLGVNDKKDLEKAQNLMQERLRDFWLENGVIMHDKSSVFLSLETTFEGECEIFENVRFDGKNIIKNSVILSGSVIDSSILENSSVGPYARVRPKCEIKDSKIGNFVECKNAKLNGVKAAHLAYLGDCEIKNGVNIGCGVIICNYDGKKKHQTIIKENAFIGSNTNIIAPITIPENTLIAAGSSVSAKGIKSLKSGGLFYQRAEHKIIENFKDF